MILWNAGVLISFHAASSPYRQLDAREREMRHANGMYLESYHYIHKQAAVKRIRAAGEKVFLDSGAFSAFTLGTKVDINRYCDYCHENKDIIHFPSVLDAIGDYKGTYHNQMEMERQGVKPLPCYHYGEPPEVLEHYVANYEYITIGGMVPISTPQLILWLDEIWERYLTDDKGVPKIKIHGFGLTSLPLMFRYPWYSVDSSTWVQWAANGMILLPSRGGQLDVSSKSSRRKVKGQHIDSVTPPQREALEREISETGADPQRLRDNYYSRWAFNSWAFPEYVKLRLSDKEATFTRQQPGIF